MDDPAFDPNLLRLESSEQPLQHFRDGLDFVVVALEGAEVFVERKREAGPGKHDADLFNEGLEAITDRIVFLTEVTRAPVDRHDAARAGMMLVGAIYAFGYRFGAEKAVRSYADLLASAAEGGRNAAKTKSKKNKMRWRSVSYAIGKCLAEHPDATSGMIKHRLETSPSRYGLEPGDLPSRTKFYELIKSVRDRL